MHNDRNPHSPPGRPAAAHHHDRQQLGIEAGPFEVPHAQDHWRVNLGEDWEIGFWSREFGCSESDLKKAVEHVGSIAGAVRAYLGSQR